MGIDLLVRALGRQGSSAESLVRLSQWTDMGAQAALETTGVWKGGVVGWAQTVPSGHLSGTYVNRQAQGKLNSINVIRPRCTR